MRVIVTGAAQGIGECVARMLAKDGHDLALASIQGEKVAAVAAELGARPVRVDIAPGATGTTGTPMSEDEIRLHENSFPLGVGGPEPVAQMVRHLLGPGGNWISGSILNVSGGEWKGR